MLFVSFFRNVNHGRPGSPTREQLVEAFRAAGGQDVDSFLTHGNAIFSAPGEDEARTIVEAASEHLRQACGLAEPAFTRKAERLAELVQADPFKEAPRDGVHHQFISFLPEGVSQVGIMAAVSPRGDVEVFQIWDAEAFSITRLIDGRAGSPNALLERVLDVPATTRNWNTVVRIVRKVAVGQQSDV